MCVTGRGGRTGVDTITWNNGRTSTYEYVRTSTVVEGQRIARQVGSVINGEFAGDAIVAAFVGLAPDLLNCLTPQGITANNQLVTLEIS